MVELLFILFNLKVIIFIDDRVIIYFIDLKVIIIEMLVNNNFCHEIQDRFKKA